jgi:hypothetical protein
MYQTLSDLILIANIMRAMQLPSLADWMARARLAFAKALLGNP